MVENQFKKFIGKPAELAIQELEQAGVSVIVTKNSKMKIEADYELVVSVNKKDDNLVELVVGEFLINIEKIKPINQ